MSALYLHCAPGTRQPKLRASCDGCYQSKIKCNKDRPMCSRCLTYGIDCVYSPSSRSGRGKKNRDTNTAKGSHNIRAFACLQDQLEGSSNPESRPQFLYIPDWNFVDKSSQCSTSTPALTPGLESTLNQSPLFDWKLATPETGMLPPETPLDYFDDMWWTTPDASDLSHETIFAGDNSLPLTSEFLYSVAPGHWGQPIDNQANFTAYNILDTMSTVCQSQTTKTPSLCDCFRSCSPNRQTLHSMSCPIS
jgi:hypothetical protein